MSAYNPIGNHETHHCEVMHDGLGETNRPRSQEKDGFTVRFGLENKVRVYLVEAFSSESKWMSRTAIDRSWSAALVCQAAKEKRLKLLVWAT